MYPVAQALLDYYRSGRDKTLRFGQYYYIQHINDGQPWPELFYETDTNTAILMIVKRDQEQENQYA